MQLKQKNINLVDLLYKNWIDNNKFESYKKGFEFTGKDNQFNNGYDEVYEERIKKNRRSR